MRVVKKEQVCIEVLRGEGKGRERGRKEGRKEGGRNEGRKGRSGKK